MLSTMKDLVSKQVELDKLLQLSLCFSVPGEVQLSAPISLEELKDDEETEEPQFKKEKRQASSGSTSPVASLTEA